MVNKNGSNARTAVLKIMGMIIPSLPFLGYRFLREYLKFKTTADKAGKIFHDELLAQGIHPSFAADLTGSYLESRDLLSFVAKM